MAERTPSSASRRPSLDGLAASHNGKVHCDGCWRLDSPLRSRRTSTIRTITRSPRRSRGETISEDKSNHYVPEDPITILCDLFVCSCSASPARAAGFGRHQPLTSPSRTARPWASATAARVFWVGLSTIARRTSTGWTSSRRRQQPRDGASERRFPIASDLRRRLSALLERAAGPAKEQIGLRSAAERSLSHAITRDFEGVSTGGSPAVCRSLVDDGEDVFLRSHRGEGAGCQAEVRER